MDIFKLKILTVAILAVFGVFWFQIPETALGYYFWKFRIDWDAFPMEVPVKEAEKETEAEAELVLVEFSQVWAEVSAYTSREAETDDSPFITANGEHVYDGGIACPNRNWFERRIQIYEREYRCNDVMNIRYRDKMNFDIWMPTLEEARAWGRRRVLVSIKTLVPRE